MIPTENGHVLQIHEKFRESYMWINIVSPARDWMPYRLALATYDDDDDNDGDDDLWIIHPLKTPHNKAAM